MFKLAAAHSGKSGFQKTRQRRRFEISEVAPITGAMPTDFYEGFTMLPMFHASVDEYVRLLSMRLLHQTHYVDFTLLVKPSRHQRHAAVSTKCKYMNTPYNLQNVESC